MEISSGFKLLFLPSHLIKRKTDTLCCRKEKNLIGSWRTSAIHRGSSNNDRLVQDKGTKEGVGNTEVKRASTEVRAGTQGFKSCLSITPGLRNKVSHCTSPSLFPLLELGKE